MMQDELSNHCLERRYLGRYLRCAIRLRAERSGYVAVS